MKLSKRELSILGATLYICEGTKERINNRGGKVYSIEFTNNNPIVIRLFLKFLRENIRPVESRVKLQLFIYPDHNEQDVIDFWSKLCKIPAQRFNKTIRLDQRSGRFKPSVYGTLKIRYSHKEHFLKLKGIIDKVFN